QKSTSTSLPRQAASETGLPSKPVRVKAGAAAPGDSGAARAPSQTRPQARQTRRAAILAVNNRIALLRPVGAEIVRDIKNLQLRKAHLAQGAPRGGDIGAMIPGTAAAIDDHRLGLVERPGRDLQRRNAVVLVARAGIDGARDMGFVIHFPEADLQDGWLVASLERRGEFFRLDQRGFGN